jgi:hypothetical protein
MYLVTEKTTELDTHRGMAAQKATELRRLRIDVENEHAALKARQEELEKFYLAAPSHNCSEAIEKTRYLLSLFAPTPAAQDPRRQELIRRLQADFDRLLEEQNLA